MNLKVNINGLGFAQRFILSRAKREIPKIFDNLKPEWIEQMVTQNRTLESVLPPEKLAGYRKLAHQYNWLSAIISDDDFLNMVPQWVHDIINKHGDQGIAWRAEQMSWLRSLFG